MSTHRTVMRDEVVQFLGRLPEGSARARFVDCTLGGAGHALALLEALPEAELLGLDRDPEAIERECAHLLRFFS